LPAIHQWSEDPLRINGGRKVPKDFRYTSENNIEWMTINTLRHWIDENRNKIGTM
jgi:hypothetical protein